MKILVTAKIANTTVGHIDHAVAYAVGLQRLGHAVYLVEQVGANRCTDSLGNKIPFEHWNGRLHFEAVAKSDGLWPRACLFYKQGEASHGMTYAELTRHAKECDLLITRSGQIHKAPEIFEKARCRVYVDGNPGSTQVQFHQQGSEFEVLDRYHYRFTMGLNIGTDACSIPLDDCPWYPILRPVVLPLWPVCEDPGHGRFTTISTWKGRTAVEWEGRKSGEKSDNWLKFIDLPRRTEQPLEIAMRIESSGDDSGRTIFEERGWRLRDPGELKTFADYRHYIGQSRGEFSVAHNRYVTFMTGWFSDRSALYLASGRPVLVQSTGIERHLPTGKGLLTYSTLEEALLGLEAINRDYPAHCRAARQIAEEYFDANRVLTEMLERIG